MWRLQILRREPSEHRCTHPQSSHVCNHTHNSNPAKQVSPHQASARVCFHVPKTPILRYKSESVDDRRMKEERRGIIGTSEDVGRIAAVYVS